MSIALSTLVLFFLLVPGILFRRFYFSEEFSKQYFKETFFGVFISTILPSLFFHFLWYFIVKIFGQQVNLFVLGDIVSQQPSNLSFQNIQNNSTKILIYNLSMFIVSGCSGYLLKQYVRKEKWDRKYKIFRFQNSWHYILKGEFFDFPRAEITLDVDTVEEIELVFVDAIMEINGKSYLYDGVLVDYELNGNNGLETISLSNSQRRRLNDDSKISKKGNKKDNSNKYYPLGGHIIILKYCELKNLNFTYLTLDEQDDDSLIPRLVE